MKNNPELVIAREKLNQARYTYVISRSVYLPRVNSYVDGSGVKAENTNRFDAYSYGVTGSQLVFDGFKTIHDISASSADIQSARHSYDSVSSNIRVKLRSTFIELLKAQEFVVLNETIARRRRQNLELVTARLKAGKEQENAVLSFKASSEQADFEVEKARRRIQLAQRQLAKELGRREFIPALLNVKGEFKPRYAYEKAPDFQHLTDDNPQQKIIVDNLEAAKFRVHSAYADLMPKVYANASVDRSGSNWPPDQDSWTAGVNLSFPLFEGGSNLASISKARSSLTQLEAQEHSSRDALTSTIEQAWNNLQDALGTLKVQQAVYEAAAERAKEAQIKYTNGDLSFDDWAVIENDFAKESKALLDARSGAAFTEASWTNAKGWTLEDQR